MLPFLLLVFTLGKNKWNKHTPKLMINKGVSAKLSKSFSI